MGGGGDRAGLTTLEVALITIVVVVGVALSALLFMEWSNYMSLQNQYNALQTQYSNLETNYSALANKYQALKTNYTNLQGQYDQLLNDYDGLQIQYTALQDQYNALQGEYNSIQSQYSNVTNILNYFVTSMSVSGSESIPSNYYYYVGLVYVPSGCTVTGWLSVFTNDEPVNVYIGDLYNFANYYAYNAGATSYGSWTWTYEWANTYYVSANVILSTSYSNGDYYVLVIENDNPYSVSISFTFTITHIYCPSS